MSDREQLSDVCKALGIVATSERKAFGFAEIEKWGRDASHWTVTLRMGRRRISTPYHMGSAHKGAPDAADVLSSLLIDADAGERTFDEHCSEFGLSRDSRAEHATWRQCRAIAPKVRRFLGDAFDRARNAEH